MSITKKLIKNTRIIILLIVLIFAIVAINPKPWNEGAAIRSVAKDSSAFNAGIPPPTGKETPVSRERIITLNNIPITNANDYFEQSNFIKNNLGINKTIMVETNKQTYTLKTKGDYKTIILNDTELVTEEYFNSTLNKTLNRTVEKQKVKKELIGTADLGLGVYDAPTNNIRKGLDLTGGTRVLLRPVSDKKVSKDDLDTAKANIEKRLNVYGLSDITAKIVSDFSGNNYISIEIAGANKEEVRELIAKQGKFEAKIANKTVFSGGADIRDVCRRAECSGLDFSQGGCGQTTNGSYACRFRFSISLSPEAAKRQAAATKNLNVVYEQGSSYLDKSIMLYLDDELVDSLKIGAELKGRALTDISISGSGSGPDIDQARTNALEQMKKLQTVLITGSLPFKLEIIQADSISPTLGKDFIKNALLIGLIAILAVASVIFIKYRKLKISIPVILTMLSEGIIILGFAALVGWNLDMAAIAGIIIAIGTGVDDQIVIADETLGKKQDEEDERAVYTWKEKIGRAFFIIMASYFTTVAAMIPLLLAGAGIVKGFALTTIAGITAGVFITRPAFAAIVEILVKHEE